jgi:hypothetical protein
MMRYTIRIFSHDSHVRFTLFVDGANAGELCMRNGAEFDDFMKRLGIERGPKKEEIHASPEKAPY